MRFFKHRFGTTGAYAMVQMSQNFVRHLRQYCHLGDDVPLTLHGGLTAYPQGGGWYRIDSYNPRELGRDIEFALQKLRLAARFMHEKTVSELRGLLSMSYAHRSAVTEAGQRDIAATLSRDLGVRRDALKVERTIVQETARPAKAHQLTALQERFHRKFSTSKHH